ncbi:MAG: hypothetical protein IGR90_03225 [Synechococcales cyanobacterium K32_A2020_035]|nr:hypothetical protein [Synechococcales cyanobacterium K32_A2020_035]
MALALFFSGALAGCRSIEADTNNQTMPREESGTQELQSLASCMLRVEVGILQVGFPLVFTCLILIALNKEMEDRLNKKSQEIQHEFNRKEEALELMRERIGDDAKSSIDLERQKYERITFNAFSKVKQILDEIELPERAHKQFEEVLQSMPKPCDLEYLIEVSNNVGTWLSDNDNFSKLVLEVVHNAKHEGQALPKESLEYFQKDIENCISWLRDSICDCIVYDNDVSSLANSFNRIPGGLETYRHALATVKLNSNLQEKSGRSWILESYVNALIDKLR